MGRLLWVGIDADGCLPGCCCRHEWRPTGGDPQSTSHGPWKKRLPMVLEMLGAVGRVRELEGRYRQG
jgi:hypothetical protein